MKDELISLENLIKTNGQFCRDENNEGGNHSCSKCFVKNSCSEFLEEETFPLDSETYSAAKIHKIKRNYVLEKPRG